MTEPGASHPLLRVTLDGDGLRTLAPGQEADRARAIADLEAEGRFVLADAFAARVRPDAGLALHMVVEQGRIAFQIRDTDGAPVVTHMLSLRPFRSVVKDYRMMVDSHQAALEAGGRDRVQAIDMGRRGLHDEGAGLVRLRLEGKIAVDLATARRLFTLICVLHQRD